MSTVPPTSPAPTTADISATVTSALNYADSTISQGMQTLSLVHQARLSQQKRAVTTLTAQYGATSAQVKAAQAAVTSSQTTVARLAMVQQQVTTTAPQVPATGWALHGRIYNAQLQPLAAHSVFLVDSQKNYLSAYGFAYTDDTGYFLISYAGSVAPPSGQNATQAQSSSEFFVEIANPSAKPVYLSATAFQPSLGSATYQDITLPAGEPVLGDPPEAIRKVALPPKGST